MSKWVRPLARTPGSSDRWHLLDSDKDFTVAKTLCGEVFPATLEVTSDEEKTARSGRCATCERTLKTRQEEVSAAVHRRSS
jgi:hypothetical protein